MLQVIWFFFMVIFFYLAFAHFRNSRTALRTFRIREPMMQDEQEQASQATQVIEEFVTDFNMYLDILSQNMRTQNLIASGAYFLAGVAILVSWVFGDII